MKKTMTCVACPLGCTLTVEQENGKLLSVTGNGCKRGITYAQTEITNPTRMLTTTVRVEGGAYPLVSVKSASPIPKARLLECMHIINQTSCTAPVALGDVIIKDILGTGIDIIATNDNPLPED